MEAVIRGKIIQRELAMLDNEEAVYFFCIRATDGKAVIERQDKTDPDRYFFDAVATERVRCVQHKDMIPLTELEKLFKSMYSLK